MEFQFGFNRLEGDSLIQTRQLRGPGSQWLGRFNRLEGDSLIQTDQPGDPAKFLLVLFQSP